MRTMRSSVCAIIVITTLLSINACIEEKNDGDRHFPPLEVFIYNHINHSVQYELRVQNEDNITIFETNDSIAIDTWTNYSNIEQEQGRYNLTILLDDNRSSTFISIVGPNYACVIIEIEIDRLTICQKKV